MMKLPSAQSVVLLILLFAAFAFSFDRPTPSIKINLDFPGQHDVSGAYATGDQDIKAGFSVSGALLINPMNRIKLGAGASFQTNRVPDIYGLEDVDFAFTPLYGILKFTPVTFENVHPELVGHLGYNFMRGSDLYKENFDLSGWLYGGLGLGFTFNKRIYVDFMYKVHQGKANPVEGSSGSEIDIQYSYFTAGFGFYF
ncbi:MAG: hypothetical protein WAN36_10605 [Calditrichia bacterium]